MRISRSYWWLAGCWYAAIDRWRESDRERGDVPGWVMVTLMSAILVVAILVPFRKQVLPAITNAIDSVVDAGKS